MKKIILLLLFIIVNNTAYSAEFKEITPSEFIQKATKKGDVKLVFLFTSWCSVCKTSFNDLISLSDRYKDKNVSIIAVSLDEKEDKLAKFLSSQKVNNFDVHIMKYSYLSEIQNAFSSVGVNYTGSIPHITLITQDGEVVADGNYKLSSFDNGLDYILNRNNKS